MFEKYKGKFWIWKSTNLSWQHLLTFLHKQRSSTRLTITDTPAVGVQKPNLWTDNFVGVSEHNLESSQTWGFRIQCLHYKLVSNNFCSRGGGGGSKIRKQRWLWIARRKTLKICVPITSKHSDSDSIPEKKGGAYKILNEAIREDSLSTFDRFPLK